MPHNHHQAMRFSDLLDKATNFTGFKALAFDDRLTDETFGYIALRKDEAELQDDEKSRFKNAIRHLIDTGIYQGLVEEHVKMPEYRMHGWGEDRLGLNRFLAWHRKYLTEFEKALG
jgi:hypothetical protein